MVIADEALVYFDDAIYYPMLLVVLERDRQAIEVGDFKFKKPYLKMIEQAEQQVREDMKNRYTYFRLHKIKLKKLGNDGTFTEYEFFRNGYSDKRRYLNVRLRNRTEELLEYYLMMGVNINIG